MTREQEKEPAFKVVDRRRFTEDGEEKAPGESQASPAKEKPVDVRPEVERSPIDFMMFIQSLAHQTMMALGIIPWPDSGLIRKELGLAKETIDIIHMLKEKTSANVTKDEAQALTDLIYQLKMAYVEISQRPADDKGPLIK